jgi:hypothetical protein
MQARLRRIFHCAACGLAAIALSSCVTLSDMPPPLQQRAECAVTTLTPMPKVSRVDVTASYDNGGTPTAIVSYNFHYGPWRRRYVKYVLFLSPRGTPFAAFDGNHDTDEIMNALRTKCDIRDFVLG